MITAPTTKHLLTTQEMANILGISKWHLMDLQKEGKVPAIKLGRLVRYDAGQVIDELKYGAGSR